MYIYIYEMGFKSIAADPLVWYRDARKSDFEEYYECVLVYLDDLYCDFIRCTINHIGSSREIQIEEGQE